MALQKGAATRRLFIRGGCDVVVGGRFTMCGRKEEHSSSVCFPEKSDQKECEERWAAVRQICLGAGLLDTQKIPRSALSYGVKDLRWPARLVCSRAGAKVRLWSLIAGFADSRPGGSMRCTPTALCERHQVASNLLHRLTLAPAC